MTEEERAALLAVAKQLIKEAGVCHVDDVASTLYNLCERLGWVEEAEAIEAFYRTLWGDA